MKHPPTALHTFSSYGPSAGSARVRIFDWLKHLKFEAQSATYLGTSSANPKVLLRQPSKVITAELQLRKVNDLHEKAVLISRQASPLSSGNVERSLLRRASHGVYDFDDALYLEGSGLRELLFPKSKIWRKSVETADIVIAGNEILASHAERFNPNTIVIPSCVEPSTYLKKTDYTLNPTPTAVWIGSPSTEHFLKRLTVPFLNLHRSHGLRIKLISAGSASLGEIDSIIDRVPWHPDTFGTELQQADFGIMPLVDDDWSRGKCAYKLLQYGAAGLPSVGSPVGVNKSVLADGGGLAPQTTEQWHDAVLEILNETDTARASRGQQARHLIDTRFSFSAWADVWLQAVGV